MVTIHLNPLGFILLHFFFLDIRDLAIEMWPLRTCCIYMILIYIQPFFIKCFIWQFVYHLWKVHLRLNISVSMWCFCAWLLAGVYSSCLAGLYDGCVCLRVVWRKSRPCWLHFELDFTLINVLQEMFVRGKMGDKRTGREHRCHACLIVLKIWAALNKLKCPAMPFKCKDILQWL